MKIKIILLVVFVLLSPLFVSCSPKASEDEWEPAKKNEALQDGGSQELEPEKKGEMKTLDFIFMGFSVGGDPRNKKLLDNMIDAVNEKLAEDMNIQLNFNWVPYDGYAENVLEMIATQGGIDAVDISYMRSDIFTSLDDNDMLMDIKEPFKLYMPNTYKLLYDKYSYLDAYLLWDNKQYIIPTMNAYPVRYCILTQKELYEEYDIKVTTLEDYDKYLEWLKINKPDLTTGYVSPMDVFDAYIKGNNYISGGATTFYQKFDDVEQTMIPMEQLPEFRTAYELLKKWNDKGYFADIIGDNYYDAALRGKLGSILLNTSYSYARSLAIQVPTNIEYEYIVLYPETTMISSPSFIGLSLLKDSDSMIETLQFFEMLYENQGYYDLIQYGIEGVNYELAGEKLSISPGSSQAIIDWWGSDKFYNYSMERPLWSEPDDYSRFFEEISFKNTVTYRQMLKQLGIEDLATVIDEETKEKGDKLYTEIISPLFDYRFEVDTELINKLNKGDYSMSADEVIAMLDEANASEIVEAMKIYDELLE